MGRIADKILPRISGKGKTQVIGDEDLIIHLHHQYQSLYGHIPLEEFLNMPSQTIIDLFARAKEESEEMEKRMSKGKTSRIPRVRRR